MTESDKDVSDKEIVTSLQREEKELEKDKEIDRIMRAFRLNPYDVLNLQPGISDDDIRKAYRKKSLLIHPDKTKNPQAAEAFGRLNSAHNDLLDESKRNKLDETMTYARERVIRQRGWTNNSPQVTQDDFKADVMNMTRKVVIDDEMQRMRQKTAQHRDEGMQQRKADEEAEQRKRKREQEKTWEETRDERIGNWRKFQKMQAGGSEAKKGKKKPKVLG